MSVVRLASKWSKARVLDCLDKGQKEGIIRFMRQRYEERFFAPIRYMRNAPENEHGFGFAILSVCCLLIETIECYRQGLPSSHHRELGQLEASATNNGAPAEYKLTGPFQQQHYNSAKTFAHFFAEPKHQQFFPNVSHEDFYRRIRCGLLHQAQTTDGWRIVRSGKFWDDSKRTINRDEFAQRLQECFDAYLTELGQANWGDKVWVSENARRKIWWLAQVS